MLLSYFETFDSKKSCRMMSSSTESLFRLWCSAEGRLVADCLVPALLYMCASPSNRGRSSEREVMEGERRNGGAGSPGACDFSDLWFGSCIG